MSAEPEPVSVNEAAFAFIQALARELNRGEIVLPSFPDSVIRIRKALDDPNCSPDKLARIATADQVLAGRLLKMATGPAQRGGAPSPSCAQRSSKLGFTMVRNAGLGRGATDVPHRELGPLSRGSSPPGGEHQGRGGLLRHRQKPDEAQSRRGVSAGMLHNIGKVSDLHARQDDRGARTGSAASRARSGRVHGPIGKSIIESWGFSAAQAAAAEGYRDFARVVEGHVPDLTDVVQVARIVAGHNPDDPLDFAAIPACRRLKLDEKNAAPIFTAANAEIQALAETLRGA
jgi:HD-like signal output (HDOD) protein